MDLATTYLGLSLGSPFVVGASPLDADLDMARRLEDAGAAALVVHSLFEEEILKYGLEPDRYLDHLVHLKRHLGVPVIASLNGTTAAGWLRYARMIERAGADALELNFYYVATDVRETGDDVERHVIDIVAVLKESIALPVAVKLSPFYSSLPHLAAQLDRLGANGLVLFNRFYQADIDPERCEPLLQLRYLDSADLLLRLRWLAILYARIRGSLAVTGGVHTAIDAVKAVMAGADCVQIVSALMLTGPGALTGIRDGFARWGDEHDYHSVSDLRGTASLARCPNPQAYERGNYLQVLGLYNAGAGNPSVIRR